ncbi:hypothetical protein H6P81_010694 [Aristolochia fimbriata]|uniref:Pentatricopeptide repeat-containing protein n=1 Tax=Aristolochia fimbriata TaxID=158543 RepID=A0AAV7EQM9_ARIFI|nr:hypothetical protein H6P81_010694 [Aristolochia fimbriata]
MELFLTGLSLPDCTHACGPYFPYTRVMEGEVAAVSEVFRWMQKQRWYVADNGVYSKLISVMRKKGQTRMAMWLFSEMRNSGCRPDTSVYNALISANLYPKDKAKALAKASGYFEKMKGDGIGTYSDETQPVQAWCHNI